MPATPPRARAHGTARLDPDLTVTGLPPAAAAMTPLSWQTVYELKRFHHDNYPAYGNRQPEPDPSDRTPVTAAEARDLLVFAARCFASAPPYSPRQIEAHRVISLVPERFGSALFGVTDPT